MSPLPRELVAAHGLPRPRTNIDRHGDKVDCTGPITTSRSSSTIADVRRRLEQRR